MDDPRLPRELERAIFELAAETHPSTVVVLLRVAHRVQEWTEPFLYRIVRVKNSKHFEAFLRALRTKPASFLAASVRHVLFEAVFACTVEICVEIISKCRGITTIGTTNSFTGLDALAALNTLPNLRHLTVSLRELFAEEDSEDWDKVRINPSEPAFAHITHLVLHDSMDVDSLVVIPALPALPRLTHLRLTLWDGLTHDNVRYILSSCPHLKVLLLTSNGRSPPFDDVQLQGYPLEDPRLVWALASNAYNDFWSDWERGVLGLVDLWTLADGLVDRRTKSPTDKDSTEIEWIDPSRWITATEVDERSS
ncbi:hypothetical protein C8F01DRAFT_1159158 [Mycena amicta]|nr:hypothetical protein C8F01DRAFT_1159158 [Mycena amicta]